MGLFNKKNQLQLTFSTENYFEHTKAPTEDSSKILLNLPCSVPITTIIYGFGATQHTINIYPTLQFLYSHHIQSSYMTSEVQKMFKEFNGDVSNYYARFL